MNISVKRFIALTISFVLLLVFVGHAQQNETDKRVLKKAERKARDKYLNAGAGIVKMSTKDQATSPLLYSGPTAMLKLEYLVHSEKLIKTFDISGGVGYLRTDKNLASGNAAGLYFNFRFNHLHKAFQIGDEKVKGYLGGAVDFTNFSRINYKFGNALYNYEYMFSLGLAGRFELPFSYQSKDFKFLGMKFHRRNRKLRLSWQMYLPVLTTIYRPNYVSILNFADPETSLVNSENFKSGLFTYFQFHSELELYYILHNNNMLKLSYLWEFHQYDPGYNKVQGALNGIYFSFILRLNNN